MSPSLDPLEMKKHMRPSPDPPSEDPAYSLDPLEMRRHMRPSPRWALPVLVAAMVAPVAATYLLTWSIGSAVVAGLWSFVGLYAYGVGRQWYHRRRAGDWPEANGEITKRDAIHIGGPGGSPGSGHVRFAYRFHVGDRTFVGWGPGFEGASDMRGRTVSSAFEEWYVGRPLVILYNPKDPRQSMPKEYRWAGMPRLFVALIIAMLAFMVPLTYFVFW